MGKITREEALAILMAENPSRRHVVEMYLGCFFTYLEAQDNIERNGAIVAHPRTGTPIENPYLKVRSEAMKDMRKLALKGLDELWAAIYKE